MLVTAGAPVAGTKLVEQPVLADLDSADGFWQSAANDQFIMAESVARLISGN
ncbi:MAG: hypothetical protein JNM56_06030 [Planctomycetia bacterium]|nr:hypothetical protein [Planctomycetia bacterium]